MEHSNTTAKLTQSLERVQQWFQALDWKDWLRQISPDTEEPRPTPPPSQRNSDADSEPQTLRSMSGPSSEDLARLERGSIPSLIDETELQPADDLVQATAREEEHPMEIGDEVDGSPSQIGDELARRMLRSATGEDAR